MLSKHPLPSVPQKIIYVAGPYWSDHPLRRAFHTTQARLLGVRVAEAGHMPLIPHSNTSEFEQLSALPESFYHAGDILLLSRCDGLILCKGFEDSKGTQDELAYCRRKGLPVFREVQELRDHEW